MAKVDFKLNDALPRRQPGRDGGEHAFSDTAGTRRSGAGRELRSTGQRPRLDVALVTADVVAAPSGLSSDAVFDSPGDLGGDVRRAVRPSGTRGREAPRSEGAVDEVAARTPPATRGPRARRAPVHTSLLLPTAAWDRLAWLAGEVGGMATSSGLLIDLLAEGPRSVQEAADELEPSLALPAEQSGVGEPWEEHNIRVPVELRRRVDEHRRILTEAGIRHATRAHLVAARVVLGAPSTPDEARSLMARRRAAALRDALSRA